MVHFFTPHSAREWFRCWNGMNIRSLLLSPASLPALLLACAMRFSFQYPMKLHVIVILYIILHSNGGTNVRFYRISMSECAMPKTIRRNWVKVDLRKTARKMYGIDRGGDSRSTENTKFPHCFPCNWKCSMIFFFYFHFVVTVAPNVFPNNR